MTQQQKMKIMIWLADMMATAHLLGYREDRPDVKAQWEQMQSLLRAIEKSY